MTLRWAVILPFLIATLRGCQAPPPRTSATAVSFRDSVGVNLHLEYDDTPYADTVGVLRELRSIGVVHARDAGMRQGPQRASRFADLAAAGIRFDLFINRDLPEQLALTAALEAQVPDAVTLIEGPNEANHEPFGASPGGAASAAQAYQAALVEAVRTSPRLGGLPVAAFTYWPPLAARADWANFHAYPTPSKAADPQLAWMRTMAGAVQPAGTPIVCTETGYATQGSEAVSEARQAALIPVLLLENFRARVTRTYLYELMDEHEDAGAPERENHFGLFHHDGSPKPVAGAISRMMAVLNAAPGVPAPAADALRLTGRDLRTLKLQRADGARVTFAWWADAQAVSTRALIVRAPAGQDVQVLDLVTGVERGVGGGSVTLKAGPGPLAFIQVQAGHVDRPALTGPQPRPAAPSRSPAM